MIGLDAAFTRHHDGQLCSVFFDGDFIGQEQHVADFIDSCLNLLLLHPNGMLPQDKLVDTILLQVDTNLTQEVHLLGQN